MAPLTADDRSECSFLTDDLTGGLYSCIVMTENEQEEFTSKASMTTTFHCQHTGDDSTSNGEARFKFPCGRARRDMIAGFRKSQLRSLEFNRLNSNNSLASALVEQQPLLRVNNRKRLMRGDVAANERLGVQF